MSVTIIMPSYDSEKFIIESIESVLAQTYSNWELIIVDDCSPDDSNKIITKYVDSDGRIKLIKLQKNSGPAVARNTAIEAASGRYIAFLDSDDVWLPNKLETQINFMHNNDLAFTYSSYRLVGEDNEHLGVFITKDKISYFDMLKTCSVGCLTAIYDTKKIGKQYMPLILKRQDYGLWLKILKLIGETKGISEPLATYRIRKNSVSSNKVKAAKYQWKIYRDIEKLSFLKSLYYFVFYAYNGVTKYKK
ncbi:glycosyltransferase family 2 protein [Campylobacter concisus]|uniref:glycosyltransferase family 2 protein n=1 Tax=Campylobacter concisus TaxID=199 RepID=UPI000CD9317E|nr:glycosyltransferase family 2 protein [Campylobacter concisus]